MVHDFAATAGSGLDFAATAGSGLLTVVVAEGLLEQAVRAKKTPQIATEWGDREILHLDMLERLGAHPGMS